MSRMCSGKGVKTVAETKNLNPKDSNLNVLSSIRESKKYKVWPMGEFRRFGDKSLNRISGGDGQKSLGKIIGMVWGEKMAG